MTYLRIHHLTHCFPLLLQGDGPQQPRPDTEAAARVPAGQAGGGPGGAATRLQLQAAVGECATGASVSSAWRSRNIAERFPVTHRWTPRWCVSRAAV